MSFDTEALVAKGRRFIELYQKQGIGRKHILIEIASTWEGIRRFTADAQKLAQFVAVKLD